MTEYRYNRRTENSRETVEFDLHRRGVYITTVVVDVEMLIYGNQAFPCGNGDDYRLTPELRKEVLETVQAERKQMKEKYPVKTYEGWRESGLTFEDYCDPGDKVSEDLVESFVNSVPPVLELSFCTQAGEAYSYELDGENGYRPTYFTFHDLGGGFWQYDGCCFYKENTNRNTRKSRLEERLDEAREEAKRNR